MKARARIEEFLRSHEGKWYSHKQVASYLKISERTARKHLEELALTGAIDVEDPSVPVVRQAALK